MVSIVQQRRRRAKLNFSEVMFGFRCHNHSNSVLQGCWMEVLPPTRDPHPFYHEQSLTSGYTTQDGPERSSNAQQTCTPNQHELWNKTVMLSRGRAPGDPHTRTVIFPCQDIEDLRTHLGDHLANPNPEYPPAHTTVEMIFPISAAFTVTNPFAENQPGPKLAQAPLPMLSVYGTPNSTVISLVEAMTPMPDPRDNMKKQRVIAKACLEAIQRADGNRYSFHNNWWSKEDEAYRFSYFCNDSILNKSRSAAGGAATIGMHFRFLCSHLVSRGVVTKSHEIRTKGRQTCLRL